MKLEIMQLTISLLQWLECHSYGEDREHTEFHWWISCVT